MMQTDNRFFRNAGINKMMIFILCLFLINNKAISQILKTPDYKHYIDSFNKNDYELYKPGEFSNEEAWNFLSKNIPLFDCPDKQLEETYYFRWWTYRKHIRKTPDGYIITEFLPDVEWAGKYNSIACAAALHFMEGRWLKNNKYLDDYAKFWLKGGGSLRGYSFWIADAVLNYSYVNPDDDLLKDLFPLLEENFASWEKEKRDSTGLFWQTDDRDGMEMSISGEYPGCETKGYRATINSYIYAEAAALKTIAQQLGNKDKAAYYDKKASVIKNNINTLLWDNQSNFYKVIPLNNQFKFSNARELHGYTPWYFNIPPKKNTIAWKYLMDPKYFYAQYGPTTAEQNHRKFKISYEGHECQWNGPSWPYATSITLTALSNVLNNYSQSVVTKEDYFKLLINYSRSHRIKLENGKSQPWIDENLNPFTGEWIARSRLKTWKDGGWSKEKGGEERGKDYNHSTFNDLIITGLVGIHPAGSNTLAINPLVPKGKWDYYCLDNVGYKGKRITVCYDKTGERYGYQRGYCIVVDGKIVFKSNLPQNAVIVL